MADINVSLGLNGFDSAVQQFTKLIGITQDGEASFITWGKAAAVAGGILATATGATIKFGTDLLDAADKLNKFSQSTGISAAKLSALTYAADLSGVSQEALSVSLGKLAKNAVEASTGSGKAADAFDTLGVSVKNADGSMRGADEILKDVSDKFKVMPGGVEKTSLAMDIFGKSGKDLIPLLNAGSDGIGEMEQAAIDLGLTMNNQTTVAAESFNDSVKIATDSVRGMFYAGISPLLPALADVAEAFSGSARQSGALSGAATVLTGTLQVVFVAAQLVWNVIQSLGESFASVAAAAVLAAQGEFSAAWEALKSGGNDVKTNFDDVAKSVNRFFIDAKESAITANASIKTDTEEKTLSISGYHNEAGKTTKEGWAEVERAVKLNSQAIRDKKVADTVEVALAMELYHANLKINDDASLAIIKANEEEILLAKVETFNATVLNNEALARSAKETADEVKFGWAQVEIAQGLNNEAMFRNTENLRVLSSDSFGIMFNKLYEGLSSTIGQSDWWAGQIKISFDKASGFAASAFSQITVGFGDAVAAWIVDGKKFDLEETFKSVARQFVSMLAQMTIQWLAYKTLVGLGVIIPAPIIAPIGAAGAGAAGAGAAGAGAAGAGAGAGAAGAAGGAAAGAGIISIAGPLIAAYWYSKNPEAYNNAAKGALDILSNPFGGGLAPASSYIPDSWELTEEEKIALGRISGFATGGQFSVTSPRLFMAGENGSETITVTPHGATQPTGGGGATIFNGPVIMDHVSMQKFARTSFAAMRNQGLRYA